MGITFEIVGGRRKRKSLRVGADVDGPLVLSVIDTHNRSFLDIHAAGDARAGGDGALGVIELVDCSFHICGELRCADIPINNFRIGVAESKGFAGGGGGVERSFGIAVKGGKWGINVFFGAGAVGEGTELVNLGRGERVGVESLPDGYQPVDVGVMEPENWIEGGVGHIRHVTAISNQGVHDVVHVLQAVVRVAVRVGIPCVGEWRVFGLRCQQLVGKIMKRLLVGL